MPSGIGSLMDLNFNVVLFYLNTIKDFIEIKTRCNITGFFMCCNQILGASTPSPSWEKIKDWATLINTSEPYNQA